MQEHIISAYTRAQAIEDGTLREVNEIARECGFRIPVALTFEHGKNMLLGAMPIRKSKRLRMSKGDFGISFGCCSTK